MNKIQENDPQFEVMAMGNIWFRSVCNQYCLLFRDFVVLMAYKYILKCFESKYNKNLINIEFQIRFDVSHLK